MTAWGGRGFVDVAGARLEYECFGPPPSAAPTIVLLHEGLGCVALWRDFPTALTAQTGLGVLAYSRAGYGQSDPAELPKPPDYMTQEAQQGLPAMINALDLQRVILLGHSDGATIAAIHAGSVTDHRVRGLVLMAPHFFTEPMGLAEIARAKAQFEGGDLRSRLAKYHSDPDATFRGWNDIWLSPRFRDWDVTDVLDYVRVPALAIQGRDDPYGTLDQIDTLSDRSYAPVDVLLLDDCGHAPFLTQPKAVLAAIDDFVTRLLRIEAAGSARS